MSAPDDTRTTDARSPALASIDETQAGDQARAPERSDPPPPLEHGRSLGRYMILERLGRGGMGVVYAAYDPELDRKIALKVLHDASGGAPGLQRNQRLLREAQAMARLSHPNVIAVHDVGTVEGRVFFAMELVEGHTLKAWLRLRSREWPEIVETFVAAGRGLQAAHEAGLVHRDFKPDNVLVGADGRVRVTDFGIARPPRSITGAHASLSASSPSLELPLGSSSGSRVLDLTLTRPGALAGTPAYMSPEQFGVGSLDARGDQFSFCVALWEALYGEPPFGGSTAAERALAVSTGKLRPAPAGTRVPAFVHAAVARGLAVDPDARHPDMAALLRALSERPVRTRRWTAAAGLVALGAATTAALVLRPDPCASAGREMASTWGDEARASVEAAMLGTGLPYAPDTWSRVQTRLDAHADAWVAGRVDACRAAQAGGVTATQTARRERCLERQRAQLHALVDVLAQADGATVERASAAVAGLPRANECADPEALLDVPAEPEAPELAALRERYLQALALEQAGRSKEALPLVEALEPDARAHGDPELLVDAMWLRATVLVRIDPARGVAAQRRAYFEAVRHHQDATAARLATALVFSIGYVQARAEAGLEWEQHADAAIDRAGGLPRTRVRLLKYVGDVHARQGRPELALPQFVQAQAQVDALRARGEPAEVVALDEMLVLSGSGAAKLDLLRFDEARAELERALHLAEEHLGPQHPEAGRFHNELGNVAIRQHRLPEARVRYETALALWTASEGERAPSLIPVLTNLGNVADMQGRIDEARAYYERALAVAEAVFGSDHVDVAFVLVNLGIMHEHAREPEQARQRFARALELREQALGPDHPALVNPLLGLARVGIEQGDAATARSLAERALVVRRGSGGEDGAAVAEVLETLGRAKLGSGELDAGRADLERMLALCEAHECEPVWTARASLALRRSLGPEAEERRAALLERARGDLERAGTEAEGLREELTSG